MDIRWYTVFVVLLSALVIFGGCTTTTPQSTFPSPSGTPQPTQSDRQPVQSSDSSGTLTLSVDSLSPGAALPEVYTCDDAGESPKISWSGIPAGTKSLVLILDDPDAPAGTFTHWLLYNIPPVSGELAQGPSSADKVLSNDAQQGESSNGFRGYYYPCPPAGSTHRYVFRLYATDTPIALPTADRTAIDKALIGHVLETTEFTTTYTRGK